MKRPFLPSRYDSASSSPSPSSVLQPSLPPPRRSVSRPYNILLTHSFRLLLPDKMVNIYYCFISIILLDCHCCYHWNYYYCCYYRLSSSSSTETTEATEAPSAAEYYWYYCSYCCSYYCSYCYLYYHYICIVICGAGSLPHSNRIG